MEDEKECVQCKNPLQKGIHTCGLERNNNTFPTKCKCPRHPDSAFTVRVKNEIPYCPRCGGIVIPASTNGLVPLDKIGLYNMMWVYLKEDKDCNPLLDKICSTFGTNAGRGVITLKNITSVVADNYNAMNGEGCADHCRRIATAIHERLREVK